MTEFYYFALSFFVYGFLGWCTEVAYAAVKQGKFVNRGFLNGPICPVYGIGVGVVVQFLTPVENNLVLLYISSTILVTAIEGITGFLLEKIFHNKWWDYSDQPLNIGGYVTLDIKDFSEQVVTPAISAIAQAVDQDLLAVGIEKAAKTATVSAKPALTDIAGVGKALDMSKAPIQNRRLILPAEIKYKYNTLDNFAKQCYAGDSQALRDAEVGRVYTCDTFSSENCPHSAAEKPGTVTGYKVTGTKDTTELTVSAGEPATGKIAEGDQLIVNGYVYTVQEDVTLVGGAGTIKVDQNLPTDVTEVAAKVISKAHALGFHRNGLALVTRQLELPMGASKAHIASANGLAVRVVFGYDMKTKKDTISFDIIYGIKELDESLLVDFS